MRSKVLGAVERKFALGVAVILVGGLASGCSSDTARFTDGIFTGSTQARASAVRPVVNQPFPGDQRAAPLAAASSGAVERSALPPAGSTAPLRQASLPPVSAPALPPATQPSATARIGEAPRNIVRQETAKPREAAADWSRTRGTLITVGEGETVTGLSRRFHVPAEAILAANDLTSADRLRAGQKIVIPSASHKAVAMRETGAGATPKVSPPADRGQQDVASGPARVATVPQTPKLKDKPAAAAAGGEGAVSGASAHNGATYKVVAGDTLYGVARKTGVNAEAIKKANGLTSGVLQIGQVLAIPQAGTAQVAHAEPQAPKVDRISTGATGPSRTDQAAEPRTAEVKGYTPPQKSGKAIASVEEGSKAVAPDATGIGKMRWPVHGRVITGFGSSGGVSSDGIDIMVPEGTPVKAAENGVVIYAGNGLKEFGNTVLVRHEDGLVTVYGYASSLGVSRGDKVRRGQEIARSGMSGNADTPKLHFEVRKNSAPVDPRSYLE